MSATALHALNYSHLLTSFAEHRLRTDAFSASRRCPYSPVVLIFMSKDVVIIVVEVEVEVVEVVIKIHHHHHYHHHRVDSMVPYGLT